MTNVRVIIEVDDEYEDADDDTGMTEEGYERLSDAVNGIGLIIAGPTKTTEEE